MVVLPSSIFARQSEHFADEDVRSAQVAKVLRFVRSSQS